MSRSSGRPHRVVYRKGGADGGVSFRKTPVLSCFLAGSATQRYAGGLLPADEEIVVSKQYPSAFFGTSLGATLTSAGVDSFVITGVTTSGCVRATCVDSINPGFITIVAREGVGDRDPRPHEANLYDMNAKYADVAPETRVIDISARTRTGVRPTADSST